MLDDIGSALFDPHHIIHCRPPRLSVALDLKHSPPPDAVCRLAQQLVARVFKVEVRDLRHPSRCRADIALARQAAMYLANVGGSVTLSDVARSFGRDRSTVSHACGLIEDLRDEPGLDRTIDLLEGALRATFRLPVLH